MKIAIPIKDNEISEHFGRCEYFLIVENGKVEKVKAPEHTFGSFPNFLKELKVDKVIVRNIGERAKALLKSYSIEVEVTTKNLKEILNDLQQ